MSKFEMLKTGAGRGFAGLSTGKVSLALSVVLVCVGLVLPADEFVWQGTASNVLSLDDPASYKVNDVTATSLPGATDTITLKVDSYAEVDNDTINVINGVKSVKFLARSSLVFNVTTNAEVRVPMSSMVTKTNLPLHGTIEKNLASELSFTSVSDDFLYGSQNQHVDYYCKRIKVNAGVLKVQNTYDATYSKKIFLIGELEVAQDAVLFPPQPGFIYTRGLEGDGLVTNDCPIAGQMIRVQSGPFTFGGVLAGGYMGSGLQVTGTQTFTGTDSSMEFGTIYIDSGTQVTGHIALVSFGETKDTSSSVGRGQFQFRSDGGSLLYLGPGGETTSRQIYIQGNHSVPNVIDAGANGGVTFTGTWYGGTALAAFGGINLILDGSNTAECVLNNWISDSRLTSSKDIDNAWYNEYRPFSLTKRGTGTWYAKHTARTFSGIVAVENGTLAFESIAPAGTTCSLGVATGLYCTATSVYEPFWGQDLATATPVGYAIRLGDLSDSTKVGTLEYRGSSLVDCSTRPIVVTGSGRILSTGGAFTFAGVSPFKTGENTLTLDGARSDNILRDVTNNVGNLSIVKKGSGTWTLLGEQTFNGDVSVEEGTLKIGTSYTWFRLNFHQNYTNSTSWPNAKKHVQAREFGLFDANGVRCNTNLEYVARTAKSAALSNIYLDPGETDYCRGPGALHDGAASGSAPLYVDHDPAKLFDGNSSTYFYVAGPYDMTNEADSNSWIRLELRLGEGVGEVTSFDLLAYDYSKNDGVYTPTAWSVEGSDDGAHWTTLFTTNGLAPADYTNNKWFSDGSDFSASGTHTGIGFKTATDGMNLTPGIRSIHVATNAVLLLEGSAAATVNKLVVDVAGMGTVKGVALASSGTVDIVGDLPADGAMIPAELSGLAGYSSLASGWTFTRNGGALVGYFAKVVDGGILVRRKGMSISFR